MLRFHALKVWHDKKPRHFYSGGFVFKAPENQADSNSTTFSWQYLDRIGYLSCCNRERQRKHWMCTFHWVPIQVTYIIITQTSLARIKKKTWLCLTTRREGKYGEQNIWWAFIAIICIRRKWKLKQKSQFTIT